VTVIVSHLDRFRQVVRFYQAAALNAVFGFSLYAILVYGGLNLYLAQLVAHSVGVTFNYFTYSRHVFNGAPPAKIRFIIAYTINYFVGFFALALVNHFIPSPYIAMAVAIVIASIINFIALKYGVFVRAPE